MEIILLIAVIAVGASGLYVTATFNTRARQNFVPLMNDATKNICSNIETASGEVRQQMRAIADKLQEDRGLVSHLEAASEEIQQQMRAMAGDLQRNRELIEQLHEQIDTRQNQLGGDLAQLDRQVTELCESLAQQGTQITGIHMHVMRQEMRAGSSAGNDSLLLAMLEAESYVDGKGWGGRPHLYALTKKTSTAAADHEFSAELADAQLDALIPVEKEPLPDGDLIEVLAGTHWPADVVGCVLVTELAALPARSEEDAPIDADAAGQWASIHPDGRPARLAVGVCRSGEHTCGLRIKGEDEIQVRSELAGGLVIALLATF